MSRKLRLLLTLALAALATTPAVAQNVQRNAFPGGSTLLLESVTVSPGARTVYVSGHVADPLDATKPEAGFGDTRTQTISTLRRIDQALQRQGMSIKDVIRLTIYVVADPALGQPDYAGMNAGYREFFGTAANPHVVARSAFEIKGLQIPGLLLEIDAVAAR